MTLDQWGHNSWLKRHHVSREEITNSFSIIDRDLKDASESDLSADWRFGIAYNAVLTLCSVIEPLNGWLPAGKRNVILSEKGRSLLKNVLKTYIFTTKVTKKAGKRINLIMFSLMQ